MTNMELAQPIEIKGVTFANRTVMAPMVPNFAGEDGAVSATYKDFYLARARAQVGFIILGATYVHPDGRGFKRQLGIYDDTLVSGLGDLVDCLSTHTRVGVQLSLKTIGRPAEAFTLQEIGKYRTAFVEAAHRAVRCGFDAIELHACHDYWLNYFLSPHFNRRRDEYGGGISNRFRLLREIVDSIRDEIGDTVLLGVRLSMDEFVEGGLTLLDTLDIASRLESSGVDYISASGGIGLTQYRMSPPMEIARGSLLPLAHSLKEVVSIPVIGVGRLDRPAVFRAAVGDGRADFAAVARSLIADPEYVAKTLQGRDDDIRPCVACNFCLLRLHQQEPLRCSVNPRVGRDLAPIKPLQRTMRVTVVGGGPAGLSFAAHAADRGAEVKLYEKMPLLGGVVNYGKLPPHKEVLQDMTDHLVKCVEEKGVKVEVGTEATTEALGAEHADMIVLATGATNIKLNIEGAEDGERVFSAEELLKSNVIPSGSYLVVGGGAVGLETAEFLAQRHLKVTVLEMLDAVGSGLHATRLQLILGRLSKSGVEVLKESRLLSLDGTTAKVDRQGQVTEMGPFDYIVFAVGSRSNRSLFDAMGESCPSVVIGDAAKPRTIFEAITEGFEAAEDLK